MIFVTVGMQMPFDRLVRAVDDWAMARGRDDVFAQIGATDWRPRHIRHQQFLAPGEFNRYAGQARVIVAHAGIGSIFTAMETGKPIIVMPRLAALRETRNDHQLATIKHFRTQGIFVAENEAELPKLLDDADDLPPAAAISSQASPQLLSALRDFVEQSRR